MEEDKKNKAANIIQKAFRLHNIASDIYGAGVQKRYSVDKRTMLGADLLVSIPHGCIGGAGDMYKNHLILESYKWHMGTYNRNSPINEGDAVFNTSFPILKEQRKRNRDGCIKSIEEARNDSQSTQQKLQGEGASNFGLVLSHMHHLRQVPSQENTESPAYYFG